MGRTPMPHSYTAVLVHIVFATKDRNALIDAFLEDRLHPYLGGIIRDLDGKLLAVNGGEDHRHLLISLNPTRAIAEVVRKIKANSSKWVHETFPERSSFGWQRGYGAFSVSASQKDRVITYINRQKEHHATRSFEDEFVALLRSHGVTVEERFLWT